LAQNIIHPHNEVTFVFWGIGLLFLLGTPFFLPHNNSSLFAAATAPVGPYFHYNFNTNGILDEAGSMQESWSPYWWVNSGAQLILQNGVGKTIQGEIGAFSPWRLHYSLYNPLDTDNGYRPQNIFRLVTRSTWQNLDQRIRFQITKINMSDSLERGGWSGILLFNRYVDGDNLYYAGIRADGYAVIKKKKQGDYYTLAHEPVYRADAGYERNTNPNLIPGKQWIGLRSVVQDNDNGTVDIRVYVDRNDTGAWELAAQAIDDGVRYGGAAITQKGYAGIRTDFMDIEFDDYKAMAI